MTTPFTLTFDCADLDGRPDHVVLTDPEGNEFCVV
jgi:hypothetical protein